MSQAYTILHIPSMLRGYAGGAATIDVQAGTLGEAFAVLQGSHPVLMRAIRTEAGAVRPHVNVFVNRVNVRFHLGLDTPLHPGDAVHILPSISGG